MCIYSAQSWRRGWFGLTTRRPILEVRRWDPTAGMWSDGSLWKSGDSESNLIFLFCPSDTSESPDARRQAAPGGPVQHRGPHWPLLLLHWNGYPALETDVCRSRSSLNPILFWSVRLLMSRLQPWKSAQGFLILIFLCCVTFSSYLHCHALKTSCRALVRLRDNGRSEEQHDENN